MLKGLGAALVGGELLRSQPARAESPPNKEVHKNEIEEAEEVRQFTEELYAFFSPYKEQCGFNRYERTTEDQDKIYATGVAKYKDVLPQMLQKALRASGKKDMFMHLYHALESLDLYGFLYVAFREMKMYISRRDIRFIPTENERENHFQTRAADFLPTDQEIEPEQIDPRLGQISPDLIHDRNREKVIDSIARIPAWTDPKKQEQFRALLVNENIRRLFQSTNCTLAEVYSMIKAAIKFRETHPTTKLDDELVIVGLLRKREEFNKKEILGPDTDEFIHFNYVPSQDEDSPKQFEGSSLEWLGFDVMRRKKSDGTYESHEEVAKRIKRFDGDPNKEFVGLDLRKSIWESKGKTTVYFNTHGMPDHLVLRKDDTYNEFGLKNIASALLTRISLEDNIRTLEDVTIIFGSCYSYDFSTNLVHEMRRLYEGGDPYGVHERPLQDKMRVPFEKISLPAIIAASQEGSLSHSSIFSFPFKGNREAIKKEGKLTGEFLMRRIQPAVYKEADMTFFFGQKNGDLLEVGMIHEDNNETDQWKRAA